MNRLLSTTPTWWQLPLRLCLFVVFWMHGSQKVLGLYGGNGLDPFVQNVVKMGFPVILGYFAAAAEFLGAWGLFFGGLTRVAAFGIACTMAVAFAKVHWKNGFFLRTPGNPAAPAGYEYVFVLFLVAVALMIGGGGNLSIDRLISSRKKRSA